MKNMRFKYGAGLAALVAVIFLAAAASAYANEDNPHKGMRRNYKMDDVMKTLNLSPEQKEKIQKQREDNKQAWSQLNEKLRAKRLELKQELEKPAVDKNRIDAVIGELKTLTGEQLELRVNTILSMKQILTPEQFQKLQEKKSAEHKTEPKEQQ
ncbi:MAG: periplasmic heavy metal sensor [Candidatus Omnitrophica bacterium]|nr:periplasmic heavy metal sensor [Candidatus Omnitrophota bacterium]